MGGESARPWRCRDVFSREQSHGRVGPEALVVNIKCGSVRRICAGEGRHLYRPRIALPREQRIEISVIEESRYDRHTLIMTAG